MRRGTTPTDRIDGWKSIGAYFGRDRTTAIRWARDRALPVHRIPGGKTATVYALRSELDAWAAHIGSDAVEEGPIEQAALPQPKTRRWVIISICVTLLAVALIWGRGLPQILSPKPGATTLALPNDPEVALKFQQGRDLVAERNAASIERAISVLRDVTRNEPSFGPGHAALAEALILSREFGTRNDGQAFFEARSAARQAMRLSADLPLTHRVTGFIAYWWDRDFEGARQALEHAIKLAPTEAQGPFWYGNILADHGNSAAAQSQLNVARALSPGSVAIQTDLAWAQWMAGDEEGALAALSDLERRHPNFATIHDCLSHIRLAKGDYAGFVAAQRTFANLRGNTALEASVARLENALRTGGNAGVQRELMEQAAADLADGQLRTHAWPSFLLAVEGDRDRLVSILEEAVKRDERWGDAGYVRIITQRWGRDEDVLSHLRKLAPPVD